MSKLTQVESRLVKFQVLHEKYSIKFMDMVFVKKKKYLTVYGHQANAME